MYISLQLVYIMCILLICWICPFMLSHTHRHNLSHTNNAHMEVVFDQIGSEKNMLVKIGSPPQDWITSPRLQVKIVQPCLKAPQLYIFYLYRPSIYLAPPSSGIFEGLFVGIRGALKCDKILVVTGRHPG